MFIDLIASLSFYVVPYLTGRFFTRNILISWIAGALIWLVIFFAVKFLTSISVIDFHQAIKFLIILISSTSLIHLLYSFFKLRPKLEIKRLVPLAALSVLVSVLYFSIWKMDVPYALNLNWDMYEHITLANEISSGNLTFLNSQISDTFTFESYTPLFSILLSIPKILFERNLLGIYWWLEYWHFLLTSIAVFFIARKVFNNTALSIISGLVSALTFESLMAYTTLFLVPQTLVAVITILAVTGIEKLSKRSLFLLSLGILSLHFIIGTLSTLVLLFFYLMKKLTISEKTIRLLIFGSIIALLISIGLSLWGQWNIPGREEAQYFNFPIIDKAKFYLRWYGLASLFLLFIGYLSALRSKNIDLKLIAICSVMILGIAIAPFSYFLKFQVIDHYLIDILIIGGLSLLVSKLGKLSRSIVLFAFVASLTFVFYANQIVFKEPASFKNFSTNVSPAEIEAARWLSFYGNKENTLIVSDPSSQYILEAVSGVNSPGGAYMSYQNRKNLIDIGSSSDPIFIRNKILGIEDGLGIEKRNETFFIVGGRYFAWQGLPKAHKESIFYNIWSPRITADRGSEYIRLLKDSPQFEPVFENEEIVILKVI